MSEKLTGGTLTPADGREDKNRASVLIDLNAGKDFTMNTFNGSGYCSVRDLANGSFQVRDKSQMKVWVVKVVNGVAS